MKKFLTSLGIMILVFSICIGTASAHVTVQPEETTQGSFEIFTVIVPTENDEVPTTEVKVEFSKDVYISSFEPKPGWKYKVQKDKNGKITSVTWVAENEGLLPSEFTTFNMQGRVADDATEIVWKAFQTYEDGNVIDWIGADDSQRPASITKVNPKLEESSKEHHSVTKENETTKSTANSLNIPLYISIVALIVGGISLVLSRKRSS